MTDEATVTGCCISHHESWVLRAVLTDSEGGQWVMSGDANSISAYAVEAVGRKVSQLPDGVFVYAEKEDTK